MGLELDHGQQLKGGDAEVAEVGEARDDIQEFAACCPPRGDQKAPTWSW